MHIEVFVAMVEPWPRSANLSGSASNGIGDEGSVHLAIDLLAGPNRVGPAKNVVPAEEPDVVRALVAERHADFRHDREARPAKVADVRCLSE